MQNSAQRTYPRAIMVKSSCPSPQSLRQELVSGYKMPVCQCVNSSMSTDHCTRGLQVMCRSKCPSSRWQDTVASKFLQDGMVLVNVGANKGYKIAEFLTRFWSGGSVSSNLQWQQELSAAAGKRLRRPCGVCADCMAPPPTSRHNTTVDVNAIDVRRTRPNAIARTCSYHPQRAARRSCSSPTSSCCAKSSRR